MHTEHVQLNLGFLGGRIKVGNRSEGGSAGVGAQDRDVPPGQLIGQCLALRWIGEVDRPDLDDHAMTLSQGRGQLGEDFGATRGDDQMVAASGEFGCQRRANAL